MPDVRASLDALDTWAAALPGCRIRRGAPLSDAEIDAAFAALAPKHPSPPGKSDRFVPRGGYRELLRLANGVTVEVDDGGEHTAIGDCALRIFDLDTLARVQREHVYLGSPDFVVGAGKTKQKTWLSRNHLVAFAGGEHAPDALWAFDARETGDDHRVYTLDFDAGFGGSGLAVDAHGAWVGEPPVAEAESFAAWLERFVAALRDVDPREMI